MRTMKIVLESLPSFEGRSCCCFILESSIGEVGGRETPIVSAAMPGKKRRRKEEKKKKRRRRKEEKNGQLT